MITVATTLNVSVLPAATSTIHVIVLVFSSKVYSPVAETNLRPLPKTSWTTTALASAFPPLVTVTVYVTLSPKLGFSMSAVLSGIISGTFTSTEALLSPTDTILVKTP